MADLWVSPVGHEYGKILYIEAGFDLSSATGIEVRFSAPSGGIPWANSASVSVLAENVTTSACGVFSASKTVSYTINANDFSASTSVQGIAGTWKGWLECSFGGSKKLISSSFSFEIEKTG